MLQLQLTPYNNRLVFQLQAMRNASTPCEAKHRQADQSAADRLNGRLDVSEGMAASAAALKGDPRRNFNDEPGKVAVAGVKVGERFGNVANPEIAAFVAFQPSETDSKFEQADISPNNLALCAVQRRSANS